MKYLLVVLVVCFVLWLMFGRGRRGDGAARRASPSKAKPVAMIACAHCGVHLPQTDALLDAGGRLYCGEAHRLAGPR